MRFRFLLVLLAFVGCISLGVAIAQDEKPAEQLPAGKSAPPPRDNTASPPHSDTPSADESSSRQTQIDVSPPSDDAAKHPESDLGSGDVDEFTPYNPMRAIKDVEVGDYYYKKANYVAAISRYREALEYKPHDAEATFKLAEALNKSGDPVQATENYQAYLKLLPSGPYSKKAKDALAKMKSPASAQNPPAKK